MARKKRKSKKKNKKSYFSKIIILIFFLIIGYLGYQFFTKNNTIMIDIEDYQGKITDYYIYGTHFNMEGYFELDKMDISINDKMSIILKSIVSEKKINAKIEKKNNKLYFYFSDKINNGLDLEKIDNGDWYILLKITGDKTAYYTFYNNTNYDNLEYYTLTKNKENKKIDIDFANNLVLSVQKTELPDDVYDITIDPGHGGEDTGSSYTLKGKTYYEADLTYKIASKLKKNLEQQGYKILLTRKNESLDNYGDNGRAVLPNKYHTKYCLSLHLNSEDSVMSYGGVEVYIPNDVDLSFAKELSEKIATDTRVGYSKKLNGKIANGVYFNYFDDSEIQKETVNNIEFGAPEMYMIREVGGKMTYAHVDGREKSQGKNIYYKSNHVAESYLIEMAYLSYKPDLEKLINSPDKFANAIANGVIDYLN